MDTSCAIPAETGSLLVPDKAPAAVLQPQNANPSLDALPPGRNETGMKRPSSVVTAIKMPPASGGQPVASGAWFAKVLRGRWETYRERLDACRDEASEEAVHELRVSIRRLLSQFVLLGRVIPTRQPQKTRRILKRQLQSLGKLRDTTVQRVFIEKQLAKFPELSVLRIQLGRRESKLTKTASRQVEHFKTNKLEKWLGGIIARLKSDSKDATRRDRLTVLALRRTEEAFAETMALRRLIDFSDSRTIHRTRIAFKKFRYSVESLPFELTGLAKRDLRKLAYYQRRMGIIQDIEVIQASVANFMQQNEDVRGLLVPFYGYLRRRRSSALRGFRASVDQLSSFWPPPRLTAVYQNPSTSVNSGLKVSPRRRIAAPVAEKTPVRIDSDSAAGCEPLDVLHSKD